MPDAVAAVEELWRALTGSKQLPGAIAVRGPAEPLESVFPVTALGTATVGASLLAAAQLLATRNGSRPPEVALDTRHVATAMASERWLRIDGEPSGAGFAPLSRFWRASDGWIRTHSNYPWHRDRLLRVLEVPDDSEAVGAAIASWSARDLEDAIVAAGGCAAAVRSKSEWRAHPQGALLDALPILELAQTGDAPARTRSPAPRAAAAVRVLDFTRVIAGPVSTRTLAAHGANVLRVDTPALPEIEELALDVLVGKRSTFVDLSTPSGSAEIEQLLADADVVVVGYRPRSLHRFGLEPHSLAARHPGLVVLELGAWGHEGPWSDRRGFDSLVQAASGIAVAESRGDDAPGALPVQALDHATGYLAAAAILVALDHQARDGGTWHVRCSLGQTAAWLLRQQEAEPAVPSSDAGSAGARVDAAPWVVDMRRGEQTVTIVSPPGSIDGEPLAWLNPPAYLGGSAPTWR